MCWMVTISRDVLLCGDLGVVLDAKLVPRPLSCHVSKANRMLGLLIRSM